MTAIYFVERIVRTCVVQHIRRLACKGKCTYLRTFKQKLVIQVNFDNPSVQTDRIYQREGAIGKNEDDNIAIDSLIYKTIYFSPNRREQNSRSSYTLWLTIMSIVSITRG